MNTNKIDNSLAVMLMVIAVLAALCLLAGLALGILKLTEPSLPPDNGTTEPAETEETPTDTTPKEVLLEETPDAGMSYIDSMIFFGESTTSHLRARGVLSGGTETHQVWADASGTRMLSSRITSEPILYPPTGESLTVAAACEQAKPTYLVLSFGLNGITGFAADTGSYIRNYGKLIKAVQAASPNTKIILQTVYPVRAADDFSVDVDTLNEYIGQLNALLPEIAASYENVRVADTASVLADEEHRLLAAYDNGDGIHLNTAAYEEILNYLRHHAWN